MTASISKNQNDSTARETKDVPREQVPLPVYVPSFITGNKFHGTIELNGIEISGEDDEPMDFVADKFYKNRVLPKIKNAPITQIELWDLQCSGETFSEIMRMLGQHLSKDE